MDSSALAQTLRPRLDQAGYTVDGIIDAIGLDGQEALLRNQTLPATLALRGRNDALATLIRLFILQQPQPAQDVAAALGTPEQLPEILEALDATRVRARVDIRPYASPDDGATGYLVSDQAPNLDGIQQPVRPDHVLGASPASTTLAQIIDRRQVGTALDLGCGCGIQSLHLAAHADRVIATDLNPRACDLTRLTFALNGVEVETREGSLYEPVRDERFDLIVSNPPYVMAPPSRDGEKLTYREGDMRADDLVRAVIDGGVTQLNPGGVLQVLGSWRTSAEDPDGMPLHLVQRAIAAGCDVLVLERERLSTYEYIEMWLADAGLLGTEHYPEKYEQWLSYFAELGITDVGLGWIWVHRPAVDQQREPVVRLESWPNTVAQPVGPAYAQYRHALDIVASPDFEQRCYIVSDHVDEERCYTPGADDPRHIVFKTRMGFNRYLVASTGLAAVLENCDGLIPLGALVDAVLELLEHDHPSAREQLLDEVRHAVCAGIVVTAP
ncbi:MAG: DUF7059 domain-containing protein [Propionibacteriaceae bacterium]